MDVLQNVQTVLGTIQIPISLIKEHKKLSIELRSGLRSIKQDLEMVKAGIENYEELQVQELSYDIEDFLQDIWVPGPSGPILTAIGTDPRLEDLVHIDSFKQRIERLEKHQQKGPKSGQSERSACYHREEDLVGIDKSKRELLELLSPSPYEGQHADGHQPRVISIVGCRGVGKTALARAVHGDPDVRREFGCVAWVVASGCNDAGQLLNKVLENVLAESGGTTSANLQDILADKRYLVFIDDVQRAELWKDTVHAFPKNSRSSRIIVTTSVHSVAAACSFGSFVYGMQCLGEADSKDLFWRKVYGWERKPAPSLVHGSKSILGKCDGLPLALTSVAKHLSIKGNHLNRSDCEEMGQTLGSAYLEGNKVVSAFGEITRTLMQCYDSLPDYGHKNCMLSLSIFPKGHQINSKSLIRRLVAEGLVPRDGHKCFYELIDRSIIEPVLIRNNSKVVARCQVHGIMLEFTVQKSVSKNFITLIQEHEPLRTVDSTVARVRRLSVQNSTKERYSEVSDVSAIRSLTIFNSDLFHLQNCKMLRLLDLEGCNGLDRKFLDGISELPLLKYLSLRKTDANRLPTKIDKLQCLETLDIRETRVEKLPMAVIMLPKLAYLFGKFELPEIPNVAVYEFLSKKSELHTLAGFVISDEPQGFEGVILNARKLKKIKMWSKDTLAPVAGNISAPAPAPAPRKRKWYSLVFDQKLFGSPDHNPPTLQAPLQSNDIDVVSSLQKRFTTLDSVSIDSTGLCKKFLASLKGPCTISSIKLRGELDSLPGSVVLSGLCNLTKLQLFLTGLSSQDLSTLQSLCCLEYLKLTEHRDGFWEGSFFVKEDGFESLHQLCLEAPKLPKLQFEQGAMTSLTSLHLFCPDTSQMQVTAEIVGSISHLTDLNEVILHYSASEGAMQAWKTAANRNPNRPCVKRQTE
ncbi:hypothetical protein ACP70R_008132 [Stipagrostis hirtigluma subsp. patula]